MSFWIDPKNAPARICIGIFANLSVNQSSVADKNLPRVSYVKALDIWLFARGFKYSPPHYITIHLYRQRSLGERFQVLNKNKHTATNYICRICRKKIMA